MATLVGAVLLVLLAAVEQLPDYLGLLLRSERQQHQGSGPRISSGKEEA
jgi:hypothetical protein